MPEAAARANRCPTPSARTALCWRPSARAGSREAEGRGGQSDRSLRLGRRRLRGGAPRRLPLTRRRRPPEPVRATGHAQRLVECPDRSATPRGTAPEFTADLLSSAASSAHRRRPSPMSNGILGAGRETNSRISRPTDPRYLSFSRIGRRMSSSRIFHGFRKARPGRAPDLAQDP